jgi:hypothetical protein
MRRNQKNVNNKNTGGGCKVLKGVASGAGGPPQKHLRKIPETFFVASE